MPELATSSRRRRSAPLVVTLVGPPGVGKTTTLVKLAVRYGESGSFSPVQILSVDNYRVAAAEQLRTYASVLGAGFEVLPSVAALDKALHAASAREVILVDTPGLGWRDFDIAEDLAGFLAGRDNSVVHLTMPASMKPSDMERIADLYEIFKYDSLLFTKLDETGTIGPIVSESWRRRRPLSYFSFGQRIPEDLEPAGRATLCDRLLSKERCRESDAA